MRKTLTALVLAITLAAATSFVAQASARPTRHPAKTQKTHRILAGSKSVRINNVGEVITNERP
jgi:hypothetical protein